MNKSSRAFDANERVAEYRKSVSVVQDNLLLFKGYLGPTIKDNPSLNSVGTRAARAAGVIVDAAGKLRCPPGTPNANQFTDMQMSNCLVPDASQVASSAAKMMNKLVDGTRGVLSEKNVKGAKKVASLLALQAFDYKMGDGQGSITDSTLLAVSLFNSAGADVLDFAVDSLHRRRQISDKRKEQLEAISERLKSKSSVDARAFIASLSKDKEKNADKRKSRSGFNLGRSKVAKSKDNEYSVGAADVNGKNVSRDLPTVNKDIDTADKAAEHLKNGKPLNEISDELILNAVLDNMDKKDKDGNVLETGRFEVVHEGRTSRLRDRETGKLFTIKYSDESFGREDTQKLVAQGAASKLRTLLDDGMGSGKLHDLSDADLLEKYGVTRSGKKSVLSDNPIYQTDDVEEAVALLALGYEVEIPDGGQQKLVQNSAKQMEKEIKDLGAQRAEELEKLGSITPEEKAAWLKNFEETHDIDLCRLYSAKNLFCNENIGVQRQNMPQSGGATKGADTPAMRAFQSGLIEGELKPKKLTSQEDIDKYKDLSNKLNKPKTFGDVSEEDKQWVFERTNWSSTEVKTEPELFQFLEDTHPDPENALQTKAKDPKTLFASQNQLKNAQIDGQSEGILSAYENARKEWGEKGTPEWTAAREKWLKESKAAWWKSPILTSSDGYVVDGHHRWAAIQLANDHLPADEQLTLNVVEYQGTITEALAMAKVFQESLGIKGKTVGVDPFPYKPGDASSMSREEFSDHMKDLVKNIRTKLDEIKEQGIYPVEVKLKP